MRRPALEGFIAATPLNANSPNPVFAAQKAPYAVLPLPVLPVLKLPWSANLPVAVLVNPKPSLPVDYSYLSG